MLQYDHLITRANAASYAISKLGVCVCRPCHGWKKWHKEQYDALVKTLISPERAELWEKCEKDSWQPSRTTAMDWKLAIVVLENELKELQNKTIPTEIKEKLTRKQQNALHVYFQLIADALNDAGMDMRVFLKPGIQIPWTKNSVKDYLWRPVQKIYLQKESTTELSKRKDIDQVYDILNRHLAERGLHVDFPSLEEIMLKLHQKNE